MNEQSATPLVVPFTDERCTDVTAAGGKGASLARMTCDGFAVPPGFVITSAAFAAAVDEERLRSHTTSGDMAAARTLVAAARPPREEIAEHYGPLADAPVAVRSSACAEDSISASYAGQQETFLNVRGLDSVVEKTIECWLSFFSDRAVFYRSEKGSLADTAMAVVVQQMVNARRSGVMFTADPVQGRRDRVVVEAAHGLGERVVSGEVTPDHYTLNRSGKLRRARVVDEQVMTEDELKLLVEIGVRLEEVSGHPQDIEWAWDDERLYLLQCRPVTTL